MIRKLSIHQSFIQDRLIFIISSVFLLCFLFTGCLSVKPVTTKSGKNYFETFYVGEEGTQYFIKPLLFKNNGAKEYLIVDITFRYKNEIKDSAIVNFSIKSPIIYKSIDSLVFSNTMIDIGCKKVEHLYSEKTSKSFVSRFTTRIALNEIMKMFNSSKWVFIIYNKNQTILYKPPRRTEKAINIMKDRIFILI